MDTKELLERGFLREATTGCLTLTPAGAAELERLEADYRHAADFSERMEVSATMGPLEAFIAEELLPEELAELQAERASKWDVMAEADAEVEP